MPVSSEEYDRARTSRGGGDIHYRWGDPPTVFGEAFYGMFSPLLSFSTHLVFLSKIDDRQITHLICVRLKHLLYDFFRGCFGPSIKEKQQEGGPKHP